MLKNIIGDQANDVLKTFTYNADQVKLSQMYALMDKIRFTIMPLWASRTIIYSNCTITFKQGWIQQENIGGVVTTLYEARRAESEQAL